jgi:serine/threonine protein kinase
MSKLPFENDSQETCPQPGLLVDFLQGKLQPPALDDCAAHVEHCRQCHETLRGLDSEDTLTEKVASALGGRPEEDSDSVQIDQLIAQLTSPKFRSYAPAATAAANLEIMADRAAEVLRCVKPDEETLGVLGEYALLRLIGSGSTGVVFQAIDRTLDRTVALKVLRPSLGGEARERFLAEARSAASIEHPNVVTIFQVGQVDRLAFIAMPWLPGQTLEAKLQSGDSLEESEIVETMVKVSSGLAAAHQQQLVHRDIKPANLWICDADNQIKILDFGLARISDDNPGLTATGMLAGTPNFMSPEQARGQELDGRSDLFSVGCLMYQLLTGRLPFGAPTVLATLQAIQNQSPIAPRQIVPALPQHLADLTMCLLEKHPADRPESAQQLIQMLDLPREQWPITVSHYAGTTEEPSDRAVVQLNKKTDSAGFGFGGWRWIMTAVFLVLSGWGAWLWAPQIIRVMTDQGEVVIESKADDVEVQVFADGKLIRVIDTQTQQSFDLKSGSYTFAAQSSGDESNTFSLSPSQMTMSRGDTQIVKVTTPEGVDSPPVNQAQTETEMEVTQTPYEEAVFDGKTFSQWINIAEFDRNQAEADSALAAAASTADSDSQKAKLTRVFQVIARRSEIIGEFNQFTHNARLHHPGGESYAKTLNAITVNSALRVIENEINEGTFQSRYLLTFLIYRFNGFFNNGGIWSAGKKLPLWQAVKDKSGDYFAMAYNAIDQPGNELLAEAFLWLASENGEMDRVVALAKQLGYAESLEKRLIEGDAELRFKKLPYAKILFYESEAIYQKYEQDLLSGDNSNYFIIEHFFCDENLMSHLSDNRGETLLRCAKDWPSQFSGKTLNKRTAVSLLVKLKPHLSEKFINEQLEPELMRLDLSGVSDELVKKLLPAKVEATASGNDFAPIGKASDAFTAKAVPEAGGKIVFKGHAFDHWLQIAKVDRDVATRTDALKAIAATAETDDEVAALIEFTRKVCRKYGGNVFGQSNQADLYGFALEKAFDSLSTDQVIEFIQLEIAEGTEPSRKFCSAWLKGQTTPKAVSSGLMPRERFDLLDSVRKKAASLAETLANHLEKPGSTPILEWLIYIMSRDEIQKTALPQALKQLAADPVKRYLLRQQIISLLGDDPDVFQLFYNDLVDVETNPIARMKLFMAVFDSCNQNNALAVRRLRLVLKLADSVLRQDDQQLKFEKEPRSGISLRKAEASVLMQAIFQFNCLHSQLEEELRTETLLPKLRELKVSLESASNDPQRSDDFNARDVKRMMADLDYLINKTLGDTDAQVPKN